MEKITEDFVINYFKDVDTMSPDKVTQYYGTESFFKFGNSEAVRGPKAIGKVLQKFYGVIKSMAHHKKGIWLGKDSAVFEADVTFLKNDGGKITIPAVSIIRFKKGLVNDFRMVMDAAPLFS